MFRLVGAVMLLFGTGGYSVCCCRDMHRRLHCLYEMKRMFEIFYSQIGYCAADFPETCKMAECYMESPFSEMLHAVSEEAERIRASLFRVSGRSRWKAVFCSLL